MVPNLPCSRLQVEDDIRKLRRLLDWQSPGFDGWMRRNSFPLINLQPGEFIFSCNAAARLVPLVSTFLFTLLEFYRTHLQHLSLHCLILVVIFIHLCEMFVCVQPSVTLLQMFHVMQWFEKGSGLIRAYYFQLQAKGPITYITPISSTRGIAGEKTG
jgi:hypothetical protein